jgi:hypothetical protein
VAWYRRSTEFNRHYPLLHFYLGAALALFGRIGEARLEVQAGLARLPEFTLRRLRARTLSDNPIYLAQREQLYDGILKAGVPEE